MNIILDNVISDSSNELEAFRKLYALGALEKAVNCRAWLLYNRGNDFGRVCSFCFSTKVDKENDYHHYCRGCQRSFDITYGSVLGNSRVNITTWFLITGRVAVNDYYDLRINSLIAEFGICYRTAKTLVTKCRGVVDIERRIVNFY